MSVYAVLGLPNGVCLCECLVFAFVCVCVRERDGGGGHRKLCFHCIFLLEVFLPSSNLCVYQAKMLSKRLLRQLDNTPSTCTLSSILPASLHTAKPSDTHTQPFLLIYLLAQTPAECSAILRCCGRRIWSLKMWKGRRNNNNFYQQTSTGASLVIQMLSTRRHDSHTLSCQTWFTLQFTKRSSCQILWSWL